MDYLVRIRKFLDIFGSNIIGRVLGIVSAPIILRLLSKEEFGEVASFTALGNGLVVLSSLGITYFIIERLKRGVEERSHARIVLILSFSSFILAILASIIFAVNYLLLFLFILSLSFYNYLSEVCRFKGKFSTITTASFLLFSVGLLLSVILIYFGLPVRGRISGLIAGYVVSIAFVLYRVSKPLKLQKLSTTLMCNDVRESSKMWPHLLGVFIISHVDKMLFPMIADYELMASYMVLISIVTLLSLLGNTFIQRRQSSLLDGKISGFSILELGVMIFAILVFMVLREPFMLILAGRQYVNDAWLILFPLSSIVAVFINGQLFLKYLDMNMQKTYSINSAISSFILLLLYAVSYYLESIKLLLFSQLIVVSFQACINLFIMRRSTEIRLYFFLISVIVSILLGTLLYILINIVLVPISIWIVLLIYIIINYEKSCC